MPDDQDLRNDSALLSATINSAAGGSTFANAPMGFGTARDPLSMTQIIGRGDLAEMAAAILYGDSHLVQKIVSLYPQDAQHYWMKFQAPDQGEADSPIDAALMNYLNQKAGLGSLIQRSGGKIDPLEGLLKKIGLADLFFEASFEARLNGRGYLLLGVDDGREWYEPIAPSQIRSLRWIEPLYFWEIEANSSLDGARYRAPNHYRIIRSYLRAKNGDKHGIPAHGLIHSSRILQFDGVYMPERLLMMRSGKGKSVIDGVWSALSRSQFAMDAAANLLLTSSMFTYGLRDLAEIKDKTIRAALEARLQTIRYSMSVLKIIPYDPETESIDLQSQNFGSLDKVLSTMLDQVSIECDIPKWKLLEISGGKGLTSQGTGEAERDQWAGLLNSWRSRHWVSPLKYLGQIALLAKDYEGERCKVEDLKIVVPSAMEYTPPERLIMQKTHMDTMAVAIDKQILTPLEARTSTYGGAEWSDRISLSEDVTKRMENAALQAGADPAAIDPLNGGLADPENPETVTGQSGADLSKLSQIDRADDATRAQKKILWEGFTIGLQYRPGDVRHGRTLGSSYGYVEKTRGADGMAIDIYLGPHLQSDQVFIVSQLDQAGQFDEHKYVIGVLNMVEAEAIYLNAMPRKLFGGIKRGTIADLEACRI